MSKQMIQTNKQLHTIKQRLRSVQDEIANLKSRLIQQEAQQSRQTRHSSTKQRSLTPSSALPKLQ
jgi:DNA-binding FrmR family transcriptional regulator